MQRRHFIRAVTASVLLPAAAGRSGAALGAGRQEWDYAFFDERFQSAHRLAESWTSSSSSRPIGVDSDVTALWREGLDRLSRDQPLRLRGVTTQSFHFCLKVLLSEHTNLDVQASRLDRNLFLWTMRTIPKT
jgi:hypothetical protein